MTKLRMKWKIEKKKIKEKMLWIIYFVIVCVTQWDKCVCKCEIFWSIVEKYVRWKWRIVDARFTKQKNIQLMNNHSLFEQNSMFDEINKSNC